MYDVHCRFFTDALYQIKEIFFSLEFYRDSLLNFMSFVDFTNVYYIDWFSDIKLTLDSWDESHLVMVSHLSCLFLDLIC